MKMIYKSKENKLHKKKEKCRLTFFVAKVLKYKLEEYPIKFKIYSLIVEHV